MSLNNLILLIGILLSVPIKAECNVEDIINERISYFSSVTFKNDAEFYSDEFRSELKRSLVKKISEFVGTSSEINVNQNKRKRKSYSYAIATVTIII